MTGLLLSYSLNMMSPPPVMGTMQTPCLSWVWLNTEPDVSAARVSLWPQLAARLWLQFNDNPVTHLTCHGTSHLSLLVTSFTQNQDQDSGLIWTGKYD